MYIWYMYVYDINQNTKTQFSVASVGIHIVFCNQKWKLSVIDILPWSGCFLDNCAALKQSTQVKCQPWLFCNTHLNQPLPIPGTYLVLSSLDQCMCPGTFLGHLQPFLSLWNAPFHPSKSRESSIYLVKAELAAALSALQQGIKLFSCSADHIGISACTCHSIMWGLWSGRNAPVELNRDAR